MAHNHSSSAQAVILVMQALQYNESRDDISSDESLADENSTVKITEVDESQSLNITEGQRMKEVSHNDSKHRTAVE